MVVGRRKNRYEVIKTTDTGDIWKCPICGKNYHLIHRQIIDGKILKHNFEEVIE